MSAKNLCLLMMLLCFCVFPRPVAADSNPGGDYQQYLSFFDEVYKTFEENYYLPPDRKIYDDFLQKFKTHIYAQLEGEHKSNDYVRWRSAWYLADELRSKDDRFTQFYPPKPADKFKHEALGEKVDLGIEGTKNDIGFLVTRMEPHSDTYDKGLREDDVILKINGQSVKPLSEDAINDQLTPLVGTKVQLTYLSNETKTQQTIEPVSKEYFKQTVFMRDVPVPGIFCLEINHFNQMTGPDMERFLRVIEAQNPKGMVLDMRGNPGGPPLAALQISGFFLKGGDEFAYFQHRQDAKLDLTVPDYGPSEHFDAPMIILVDADTGSAAELFTGIMQFRGRAAVLGVNTAGQILLKSMFPMSDGSMLALVKARGYYPDGHVFGFDGITPNKILPDAPKDGLRNLAAAVIAHESEAGN